MSDLDHRVGVREQNLVVRNLRLSNVTQINCDALIEEIDRVFGIDEVSYNIKDSEIHLAYDAVNINLDGIEELIKKHGADAHDDWWTKTKDSYYKFVDQNVKDNAKHEPWSCHSIPRKTNKKNK
ncbi:TPA: cation transporter [Vibrio vulnificus]|uniref:cation transporter n=1 Tax=Vibrio harveyi TaxID=669 RepID=UPI001EFE6C24|nr:cation transporter [Vibrio harveyi]MCG9613364.1 cation transporter [Vibrio harveyi]MCG9668165.1 cation transporter [Vibrio harveyi]HDY7992851.1 cation transporter [Vibrio vulnificus]HDY8018522.1 cation transporter [Vibrio vulnificus]